MASGSTRGDNSDSDDLMNVLDSQMATEAPEASVVNRKELQQRMRQKRTKKVTNRYILFELDQPVP